MASTHGPDTPPTGADPSAGGGPGGRPARLDSLTGLRFFAALAVFFFHFGITFDGGSASLAGVWRYYIQGPVGVSFFFILSGFVLAWSHRDGDRAGWFIRRRLARIGPLHVVTTAGMAAIVVALRQWPGAGQALVSLALLPPWSPAWSAHQYLDKPSWSLGCELFFYLLFPLLYPALVRAGAAAQRVVAGACVLSVFALAAALRGGGNIAYWLVYFFPPSRLIEFVLGVVLALEVRRRSLPRLPLAPVALVAGAAYLGDGWAGASYSKVAVTLVPLALLVVAAAQSDVEGRPSLLRSSRLVTLGAWSFAFYLVHFPVMTVVANLMKGRMGVGATVLAGVVSLLVSLAASGLLHSRVERPLELRLRGGPARALPVPQRAGPLGSKA